MRPSDRILAVVTAIRAAAPAVDLFDPAVLRQNLVLLHQVITASEQLLVEALAASSGALRDYLAPHIEEERDHARWLAADMAGAGIDVAAMPRSRTAIAMAGSQYYLLKHVNPACLLGYMLVLECYPMSLHLIEQLEQVHGAAILKTVRYHAEHDPDHGAALLAVIDQLYCQDIMDSAVHTALHLNALTQELHHGHR